MDQDVLRISTESKSDITLVRVSGELDSMNVADLQTAFAALLNDQNRLFVLDLSDLEFIDSAGLGGLIAVWEHTMEQGCFLALGACSPRVSEVLQITGLCSVLQPRGSMDAAMDAVREMREAFPEHA